MKRKNVVGWTSVGVSLLMLLGILFVPEKEVKAAAYEFWGTAATIKCHTTFSPSSRDEMSVSVNGSVVAAVASSSMERTLLFGNEVTCNGWRLTSCAGTGCQVNN